MEKINKKYEVSDNSSNRDWRNNERGIVRNNLIFWGIFLIIVAVAWAAVQGRIGDWILSLNEPEVPMYLSNASAELSLASEVTAITEGETFTVDIILNSGESNVDGVDIYSLHYDPKLLQVVDSDPEKPGIQIVPGDALPFNAYNLVDAKTGDIKFSQLTNHETSFSGRGILAKIPFKALSAGTAYITFDFDKGSTVDSNVAYRGTDRLRRVIDGVYTILPK